ncbi:P-type ATPase (P-ATPase) Superfamily, partial [Thraustotheca clavata]
MCGDGTNDCGALKAAHVGLALSNAEASIVAPFTSCDKSIIDVVALIKEGRCALMTSFVAFKFMVMYPIIQVVISATLYASMITMGNNQFLFDDMIVVLGLSMLMLKTEPSKVLTHHRPPNTLFDGSILYSLAGHIVIYLVFFFSVLYTMRMQSWYCSLPEAKAGQNHTKKYGCFKYEPPSNDGYTRVSFENTILWLFGHWEFVLVAIAFNIKDPFRQSVWTNNRSFVAYTSAISIALLFLTLENNNYILKLGSIFDVISR